MPAINDPDIVLLGESPVGIPAGIRGNNRKKNIYGWNPKTQTVYQQQDASLTGVGNRWVPSKGDIPEQVQAAFGTKIKSANLSLREQQKDVLTFSPPSADTSNVISYPEILKTASADTDYVLFTFHKYIPPYSASLNTDNDTPLPRGQARYNQTQKERSAPLEDYDVLKLYMPEDIQNQMSARWGGEGFANVGKTAVKAAKGDIVGALGVEGLADSFKNRVFKETLSLSGKTFDTNVTLNQALGLTEGRIINPYVELLYEAPDLRGFDLTFKMAPKNINEANYITRIVKNFRKAMLPSFGTSNQTQINVPKLCQVSFMRGSVANPMIPQFKLCAIVDVSVNFTPDGGYSTIGSNRSMTSQTLKVTFKETKTLFENDIDGGF